MTATGVERVVAQPFEAHGMLLVRPVVGFTQNCFDEPIDVLPSPTVTVMFQIGQTFEGTPPAFIAGPRTSAVAVTWQGQIACVDVKLSPVGAAALLGPVLDELADRAVSLADVLPGHTASLLLEQLALAPDWVTRLDHIQRFLRDTSRSPHPVDPRVSRAWSHLRSCGGAARISEVARASGWSHRHFAEQFRRYTGLTPKSAARLLRIQRTMETLSSHVQVSLAQVAVSCGYADQAHMSREFLEFTGFSPDRFRRNPRLVPAGTVPSAVGSRPAGLPR